MSNQIGVLKISHWPRGTDQEPVTYYVRLSAVQGINLSRPCQIDAIKMTEEEYNDIQAANDWQEFLRK